MDSEFDSIPAPSSHNRCQCFVCLIFSPLGNIGIKILRAFSGAETTDSLTLYSNPTNDPVSYEINHKRWVPVERWNWWTEVISVAGPNGQIPLALSTLPKCHIRRSSAIWSKMPSLALKSGAGRTVLALPSHNLPRTIILSPQFKALKPFFVAFRDWGFIWIGIHVDVSEWSDQWILITGRRLLTAGVSRRVESSLVFQRFPRKFWTETLILTRLSNLNSLRIG
jgi:hypothetical protein